MDGVIGITKIEKRVEEAEKAEEVYGHRGDSPPSFRISPFQGLEGTHI